MTTYALLSCCLIQHRLAPQRPEKSQLVKNFSTSPQINFLEECPKLFLWVNPNTFFWVSQKFQRGDQSCETQNLLEVGVDFVRFTGPNETNHWYWVHKRKCERKEFCELGDYKGTISACTLDVAGWVNFKPASNFSPPGKDQSLVQWLQSRLRVGASNRKRVLEICLLKNGAADLQETN